MGTTSFKGYGNIGQSSLSEVIEDNLVSYIEWGFLQLGAFYNISIPSSGVYGGDRHKLVCVNDPRYTSGQVWEGYRKNWVWQSGLTISTQPIAISGVFVDGSFLPRGSGYHINYPDGRVIFDSAISTTSTVQLEYSHKWVDTVSADDVPWFKKSQNRSFRVDSSYYISNSGNWNELADTRLQMPFVAVEVVGRDYEGYQLGGGQWIRTPVLLHVVAEESRTAKKIANILSSQNEATIFMYSPDLIANDNKFPLDYRGETASGALCYPDLVAATGDGGYRYEDRIQNGKIRLFDSREQDTEKLTNNVYHSKVRWNTEVISTKI